MMLHEIVRFQGHWLWLHDDDGEMEGALLSPLAHYNETGDLLANPFTAVSFACIFGDEIKQFSRVIGHVQDLGRIVGGEAP